MGDAEKASAADGKARARANPAAAQAAGRRCRAQRAACCTRLHAGRNSMTLRVKFRPSMTQQPPMKAVKLPSRACGMDASPRKGAMVSIAAAATVRALHFTALSCFARLVVSWC